MGGSEGRVRVGILDLERDWLVFVCFLFISVLMMLFMVIVDLFHDRQLGGFAKLIWVVVLVMFPLIGLFVYLMVRGGGMSERAMSADEGSAAEAEARVNRVSGSSASELEAASTLHDDGKLTDEELSRS